MRCESSDIRVSFHYISTKIGQWVLKIMGSEFTNPFSMTGATNFHRPHTLNQVTIRIRFGLGLGLGLGLVVRGGLSDDIRY